MGPTTVGTERPARPGNRVVLSVLLVAVTCLSQFYRVSNSVIAPELARELGLTSAQLGLAGGVFFVTLLLMQIPVGMWFDRYGPRCTVTALSVLAVAGAVLLARAQQATDLIIARGLIGCGCAASFMATVLLCSRWFAPQRFATVLSWIYASSNLGTLAAATPLALASATLGWRHAFLALAGLTVLVTGLFFLGVRDYPPGQAPSRAQAESFGAIWGGLLQVWRTPGLLPVLAMHTFAYATMLTVLGVWAGPYLYEVYQLDSLARGHVLLAMGGALVLGILCYGLLERLLRARKKVVILGVLLTMATLLALAALVQPPLWLAVSLLVTFTFVSAYAVVIVAQGRALFPDHLAGRGVTTVNMAQVLGAALLPMISGYMVDVCTRLGSGSPDLSYRLVFAFLALCSLCGLLVYRQARESAAPGRPEA
ncbi:MAG: MFS transporter [Candidatus Tectimicrobiota bacterium]